MTMPCSQALLAAARHDPWARARFPDRPVETLHLPEVWPAPLTIGEYMPQNSRPLSLSEQEVVVRRSANEDIVDIDSSIPHISRQLEKLADLYGIQLIRTPHGVRGKFPKRILAFRKPINPTRQAIAKKRFLARQTPSVLQVEPLDPPDETPGSFQDLNTKNPL